MKPSTSHFHDIRGLRYHVRTWGAPTHTKLIALHGWMDVSASFQFFVDALSKEWYVIAPDWRGFGLTDWSRDPYWFPDYYGDLDAILGHYAGPEPVRLLAHSMGGNIACNYAGIRPERVQRLVSMEGFGYLRMEPELAPERYARWLGDLAEAPKLKPYASLAEVAERLRRRNPRLTPERASFLAEYWARPGDAGGFILRADPKHKMSNPVLNRMDENMACWRRITAPVMWVWGRESTTTSAQHNADARFDERRGAFRDLREVVIDGAGHMMHHDQPEQLARLLEPFLAG